jgi:hypothetical protein
MPKLRIDVEQKGADKAKKKIDKLGGSLGDLRSKALLAAGGFLGAGALVAGMKAAVEASAEQELAEKKLAQALGTSTDELIKQAGALQQNTVFGDEAIIQQQAYLASIGMTEAQIKEMIPVSLDLAAATGMTLESAVKNASKTLSGMTGELGESVPALRNLTAEQLKAGDGIKLLGEQFKGMAETEAQSLTGSLTQAKNAVGDAAEALGDLLAPMVGSGAGVIKTFAEGVEQAFDFLGRVDISGTASNFLKNLDLLGKTIVKQIGLYFSVLPDIFRQRFSQIVSIAGTVMTKMFDGIKAVGSILWEPISMALQITAATIENTFIKMFNFIKQQFNNLATTWIGEKAGLEPLEMTDLVNTEDLSMANTTIGSFFSDMNTNNVDSLAEFTEASGEIWAEYTMQVLDLKDQQIQKDNEITDNQINNQEKTDKVSKKLTDKEKARVKALQDARKKAGAEFVSNLGTIADEFPALGKAAKRAAQVQALVDAYASANASYKAMAGIPVVGPALAVGAAAVALAAGIANVRQIEKAALGADFVTSGPQLLMVGDNQGGRERVQVTPLSSPNVNGPRGGDVVVNISGNLLSENYTEDVIVPQIKEALRRGETI